MVTRIAAQPIAREWHVFSARGQVLGRMAAHLARLLMGKHKRIYTPNIDTGDYVVITDAKEVVLTGKKSQQKTYQRYSGYPGGLYTIPLSRMLEKHPDWVIKNAVSGMLPDNRLKKNRLSRLKIFVGSEHPYGEKLKIQS